MSAQAMSEAERARVSLASRGQPMSSEESRAELLVGGAFLLAALAMALLSSSLSHLSVSVALLYVVVFAVTVHLRFDVGVGFTVPTQAIFVPMLFAVPPGLAPLLVALALALSLVPEILAGRLPLTRILTVPGNSWFAIGPALVLLLSHDHSPEGRWWILLLALAAQLWCDFAASLLRERLLHSLTASELAEEMRQVYVLDVALAPLGFMIALAAAGRPWVVLLVAPLFLVLREFSKERSTRLTQLVELNDAYQGTARLLGNVVDADDAYTGEHSRGVVSLAVEVAWKLGLDRPSCRSVEFAALLHDVGKITVPKEIINKPGGLDEDEWAVIKMHTIEGQNMLDQIGGMMSDIGRIVRSSHERWDGSGYPDRLSGRAIPLESRIISACDAFSAMTTTRSYRKAMPVEVAILELRANAGTQFDPAVVNALVAIVEGTGAQSGRASDELEAHRHSQARLLDTAVVVLPSSSKRAPNG